MSSQVSDTNSATSSSVVVALVPQWDSVEATRVLAPNGRFIIGSSPECDIQLSVDGVAGRHCELVCQRGRTRISPCSDLLVSVNEVPVLTSAELQAGDTLKAGCAVFRVEFRRDNYFTTSGPENRRTEPAHAGNAGQAKDSPATVRTRSADTAILTSLLDSGRDHVLEESRRELQKWQQRLEERGLELDRRSTFLADQHNQVLRRRAELEQRSAQIEATQEESLAELNNVQEQFRLQIAREREAMRSSQEQHAANLQQREEDLAAETEKLAATRQECETLKHELATARQIFDAEQHAQRAELTTEWDRVKARIQEADNRDAQLQFRTRELHEQIKCLDESRRELELFQIELDARQNQLESDLARERAEYEQQMAHVSDVLEAEKKEFEFSRLEIEAELDAQREELRVQETAQNDELLQREARLVALETELESRAKELDARDTDMARASEQIQALTELQAEVKADREQLETLRRETDTQRESLAEKKKELSAREYEVEQREQELETRTVNAGRRESALDARAASVDQQESDLSELRTDLETRESELISALKEKESAVDQLQNHLQVQSEELNHRAEMLAADQERLNAAEAVQQELVEREARLVAWESELSSRHMEIADRVFAFQQIRKAADHEASTVAEGEASASVAEIHQYAADLEEARKCAEQVTSERDELSTALTELRQAFDAVREDLAQYQSASTGYEETIRTLKNDLACNGSELAELNEALTEKDSQVRELEERLRSTVEEFEANLKHHQEELRQAASLESSPAVIDEESLLDEVESLRNELAQVKEEDDGERRDFVKQVHEYEQLVEELKQQLEEATASQTQHAPAVDSGAEHLEVIAQLTQRLEEREEELQELRAATESTAAANTAPEELNTLHRELDSRTMLLDTREEELRERQRMVEQSEEEVESQRRELLEARQQLELARAELRIAMDKPHDVPADPDIASLLSASANQKTEAVPQIDNEIEEHFDQADDDVPQVRSELAELFGISTTSAADPTPDETATSLSAVDDYSQEKEAAVSISFADVESVLTSAPGPVESEQESLEEDGDEFVAKYMEQLLARNREKAGGSLPDELKNTEDQAENQEEEKPQTGNRSFIDAYLSGEFGQPETELVVNEPEASAEETPRREPRQKIDLETLRSDMNSFRQLSTKSVENALASHARRQSQTGINARKTILTVLSLVAMFLVAAAILEVIPFGIPIYLSIVAVVVSGLELAFKVLLVQQSARRAAKGVAGAFPTSADDITESIPEEIAGPESAGILQVTDAADNIPAAAATPAEQFNVGTIPAEAEETVTPDGPVEASSGASDSDRPNDKLPGTPGGFPLPEPATVRHDSQSEDSDESLPQTESGSEKPSADDDEYFEL